MFFKTSFIGELKSEAANTKKILGKVPLGKADWKPHQKSMTIGRLATHIAETTHWIYTILEADEFDFAAQSFKPRVAASVEELLQIVDTNVSRSIAAIENTSDEGFEKKWTVKRGEQIVFSVQKKIMIRSWGLNHTIHHRGQLSVYLRLLNIPVPGLYGPSADEK
jgi:uncharacterized damage-inducible protein DinB